MKSERAVYLYEKFIKGDLGADEQLEWDNLGLDLDNDQIFQELVDGFWGSKKEDAPGMNAAHVSRVEAYILAQPQPDLSEGKPFIEKLWTRIAIACAIAFIVIGAYFFRSSFSGQDVQPAQMAAADFPPGKSGATLTLANGQKILIHDALSGDIASQSGVKISKTKDGRIVYEVTNQGTGKVEYNTLTTTPGEQTQVRLPDGSLVWLNAASSLKYPSSFANLKDRRVELSGEAYFEITKDKKHPFLVQSRGQTVKVIGTRFNINSYLNEPATATTLLEGSIIFVSGDQSTRLIPGEQILASKEGITIKKNVNIDNIIDWQSDDFNFDGIKLKAALRKLERWYNVEFILGDSISEEMEAGGWISRKNNLSAVLKLISKSHQVKFRLDQNKVYVSQ